MVGVWVTVQGGVCHGPDMILPVLLLRIAYAARRRLIALLSFVLLGRHQGIQ